MYSLETSDSQSSNFSKQTLRKTDVSNIIKITFPVPCTLCKSKFDSRSEQLSHYRSESHLAKLIITVREHSQEFFGPQKPRSRFIDDVQKVYLECDDSFSQQCSQLIFLCADCNVEFNTENGYLAHLRSKRHFKSSFQQAEIEVKQEKVIIEFECIE
ncbi:C2H2-type zinc finger domain-containing protein [Spironucleus salmonicida]|uniref:C2H2-type zinc finger domain-containing protein n=1 Tax=Spironucleus salmonicida TaxID=348837 RepID=V6LW30_9EUKA|nr:C2H2-type zinc finger domain-containing protein [Spironucleus salmonicida]|eukprot:EST45024.1 C2H2-type zinc finger domain-containing protein [Spironucleus salmonicida]